MISALCWVPQKASAAQPLQYDVASEAMEELIAQHKALSLAGDKDVKDKSDKDDEDSEEDESMKDSNEKKNEKKKPATGDAFLSELMKGYDDEPNAEDIWMASRLPEEIDEEDDDAGPDITIGSDEDSEDEEDTVITETDCPVVIGRSEPTTLEFQLFDPVEGGLFCHHDIQLPAFPLSLAWMNCEPKSSAAQGSFIAVGSFQPSIEIWNLDVLNTMEPVAVLGGREEVKEPPTTAANKKKQNKKRKALEAAVAAGKATPEQEEQLLGKFKEGSHKDAVLSLGWSPVHRQRLASGSADNSVKLWDVTTQQCVTTFTHHTDKVQSLEWNPREASILLTGSYDKRVSCFDTRAGVKPNPIFFSVGTDEIECVTWNPENPMFFLASTDQGKVYCYNVKQPAKPIFILDAHHKQAATSVSFCRGAPTLFATSSTDKTVKLWDAKEKPVMLVSKDVKKDVGGVMAMKFYDSMPFLLAFGGTKGQTAIWDITSEEVIAKRYRNEIAKYESNAPKRKTPPAPTTPAAPTSKTPTIVPALAANPMAKKEKKMKAFDSDPEDSDQVLSDDDDEPKPTPAPAAASKPKPTKKKTNKKKK